MVVTSKSAVCLLCPAHIGWGHNALMANYWQEGRKLTRDPI